MIVATYQNGDMSIDASMATEPPISPVYRMPLSFGRAKSGAKDIAELLNEVQSGKYGAPEGYAVFEKNTAAIFSDGKPAERIHLIEHPLARIAVYTSGSSECRLTKVGTGDYEDFDWARLLPDRLILSPATLAMGRTCDSFAFVDGVLYERFAGVSSYAGYPSCTKAIMKGGRMIAAFGLQKSDYTYMFEPSTPRGLANLLLNNASQTADNALGPDEGVFLADLAEFDDIVDKIKSGVSLGNKIDLFKVYRAPVSDVLKRTGRLWLAARPRLKTIQDHPNADVLVDAAKKTPSSHINYVFSGKQYTETDVATNIDAILFSGTVLEQILKEYAGKYDEYVKQSVALTETSMNEAISKVRTEMTEFLATDYKAFPGSNYFIQDPKEKLPVDTLPASVPPIRYPMTVELPDFIKLSNLNELPDKVSTSLNQCKGYLQVRKDGKAKQGDNPILTVFHADKFKALNGDEMARLINTNSGDFYRKLEAFLFLSLPGMDAVRVVGGATQSWRTGDDCRHSDDEYDSYGPDTAAKISNSIVVFGKSAPGYHLNEKGGLEFGVADRISFTSCKELRVDKVHPAEQGVVAVDATITFDAYLFGLRESSISDGMLYQAYHQVYGAAARLAFGQYVAPGGDAVVVGRLPPYPGGTSRSYDEITDWTRTLKTSDGSLRRFGWGYAVWGPHERAPHAHQHKLGFGCRMQVILRKYPLGQQFQIVEYDDPGYNSSKELADIVVLISANANQAAIDWLIGKLFETGLITEAVPVGRTDAGCYVGAVALNSLTDFAVRDGNKLVETVRAFAGLTDANGADTVYKDHPGAKELILDFASRLDDIVNNRFSDKVWSNSSASVPLVLRVDHSLGGLYLKF